MRDMIYELRLEIEIIPQHRNIVSTRITIEYRNPCLTFTLRNIVSHDINIVLNNSNQIVQIDKEGHKLIRCK